MKIEVGGRQAVPPQQNVEQLGAWLQHPLAARHRDIAEQPEEGEAALGDRECLGREIRDRIERHTGRREPFQQRDEARNGAGEHFLVTRREGVDQRVMARILELELGRRLCEWPPSIVLEVPRHRGDFAQKSLHPGGIAVEQLAIEMARVPIDQHAAQIKDDVPGHVTAWRSRGS